MPNPIRDLFAPRSAVGLQIGDGWIAAVRVEGPADTPVVEQTVWREIEEGSDIDAVLRDCFEALGSREDLLVTGLSAEDVFVRDVEIELQSARKLEKVLKYQMEPLVPLPLEAFVVDFLPPAPGRPVTAVAAAKEALSRHLERLSRLGREPAVVTLEDAALLHLHAGESGERDRLVGLVHFRGKSAVFQAIEGNRPVFLRAVASGSGLAERLRETLELYRLQHPESPVSELLLTGPGAEDPGTAQRLSATAGVPASLWRPLPASRTEEPGERDQARFAVAFALAAAGMREHRRRPNFRREEFRLKTPYDLSRTAAYGVAVLLLLMGLYTYQVRSSLSEAERSYTALNQRASRILSETFPDTRTIIRGREMSQMEQKIQEIRSRYGWLEELTADDPILDLLLVFTKTLAGFSEVLVDNLSIEGSRILLDGRAPSFQVVDSLKGRMEQMGFFAAVDLVGAELEGRDRMVRFTFHLERRS